MWEAKKVHERNFYMMEISGNYVIDARHKANISRLINSSCQPNCRSQKCVDAATGEVRVGIFAMRDIEAGEELTISYCDASAGGSLKLGGMPLTAQSAVVAPLTPTIAEARAFELVRGTHFALFSLLAGLELIPTLLMSVLKQNKPQKKKHGFKTRMKTKDGRKIIKARRRKGRKQLGYGQ